ncbi:hypothetical protein, partial [Chromobacterium phragmitis]
AGLKSVALLQPKHLREIAFLFARQVIQTFPRYPTSHAGSLVPVLFFCHMNPQFLLFFDAKN